MNDEEKKPHELSGVYYALEPVDTAVLGEAVLSLHNVQSPCDLVAFERQYRLQHDPAYVGCRLAFGNIRVLHALQAIGFRVIECQLQAIIEPCQVFDTSAFPYVFEKVVTDEALDSVLSLAGSAIQYDRFSIDPEIPGWFSGARYEAYVRQSYGNDNDEVWRLRETRTGRTVAFRSFRRLEDGKVRLLLEGVSKLAPTLGVGAIERQFFLSEMCRRGVPSLIAHVSAVDLTGFTLEITGFGFRLTQAFAVLRKVYKPLLDLPCPA